MIRKSIADARDMLHKTALAHALAMSHDGDARRTQEELDEACLYFAEMMCAALADGTEEG